jgi:hypothetical protein
MSPFSSHVIVGYGVLGCGPCEQIRTGLNLTAHSVRFFGR